MYLSPKASHLLIYLQSFQGEQGFNITFVVIYLHIATVIMLFKNTI